MDKPKLHKIYLRLPSYMCMLLIISNTLSTQKGPTPNGVGPYTEIFRDVTRCIFVFEENHCVFPIQPGNSNKPPAYCI